MSGSANRNREDVRRHRQRLRERGLRPVQIWVPDVRSPGFLAEARRQSALVARSPNAADDQAFADALADETAWGAWEDVGTPSARR
jgi:Protein  of unknown function (DUF3018)